MPICFHISRIRTSNPALALILSFLFAGGCVLAQLPVDPVQQRLNDVCTMLQGGETEFALLFAPSFRSKVPDEALAPVIAQYVSQCGPCTRVEIVERKGEFSATATAFTKNNFTVSMSISVEKDKPHLIEGLFFKPPVKLGGSIEIVKSEVEKLSGTTSFFVINVATSKAITAHNQSQPLAIGSTFKLYILGYLTHTIMQGNAKWSDVVELDSAKFSLPSGELQKWPHGSPITLHTLATLMISKSDNTATDLLLNSLGRSNIEVFQQTMGNKAAKRNVPFLSTYEMFRLKFSPDKSLSAKYAGAEADEKSRILNNDLASVHRSSLVFGYAPYMNDKIEWFASTEDLATAMRWFYNQRDEPAGRVALELMGVNHGLDISDKVWNTVAYKGGSESGVLNFTFLLQHNNGTWYAMSATWNKDDEDADLLEFSGLITRAIQLLE